MSVRWVAGAGFGFPVLKRKLQLGFNGMFNRNHFNGVENGYTLSGWWTWA
jgi:hypothetical protein